MQQKSSLLIAVFLFISLFSKAQDTLLHLSKDQFISIVRTHHPVIRQAGLQVERATAETQAARGAFDPAFDVNIDRKTFDNNLYYSYFNPQLTIPIWYGIDIKGGVEEIAGNRLSNEATLGKTSYLGVKVLANNLLFDRRRAILRQAQDMRLLSEANRLLIINDLLYDALDAYWNWVRQYQVYQVNSEVVRVNEERLKYVRTEYEQGSRPAIDTTEALAQLQQFYTQQNQCWLAFQNAGLELSNYLWLNDKPVNWNNMIVPNPYEGDTLNNVPVLELLLSEASSNNPKLSSIGYKLGILETERRLKAQYLLPKLSLNANVLAKGYGIPSEDLSTTFLKNNYKLGVDLHLPLFMREARGQYRSAKIKLQETGLERSQAFLEIENKIRIYYNEVLMQQTQIEIYQSTLSNYQKLFRGEKLRFESGESTLFMLNARENKVLETAQKLFELRAKWHKSYAGLFWAAGQLR